MKPALLCLLLLACGDDDGGAVDPAPDGGPLFPDAPPDSAAPPTTCTCVALGVDYVAGVGTIARLDLPSLQITRDAVPGGISGDPVVRVDAGRIFVVNRFGTDNVTVIDGRVFRLVAQFSTGAGTNPQDVAIHADTVFVPLFGDPGVAAFRLRTPVDRLPDLDTSAYDTDGNPNAASAAKVGDRVYVTLGNLDDGDPYFAPRGPGRVLVVDVASRAVVDNLELQTANPLGFLRRDGDSLLVATAPSFSAADGCIERITTGASPGSACLVENAALGGYATALAPTGAELFAAVSFFTDAPHGKLVRVSASGEVDPAPLSGPDEVVTDAAYCGPTSMIVYNDQATGGLQVYDVAGGQRLTSTPLDIGLPSAFSNGLWCF